MPGEKPQGDAQSHPLKHRIFYSEGKTLDQLWSLNHKRTPNHYQPCILLCIRSSSALGPGGFHWQANKSPAILQTLVNQNFRLKGSPSNRPGQEMVMKEGEVDRAVGV